MVKKNVVGMLGAGRISRVHAENILKEPTARFKTLADPFITPETEAWAKSIGIEVVSTDPSSVFDDEEISCVYICSPTTTHCEYTIRACEKGKNIYCEKPIGKNLDDILKAVEAVEKSGVKYLLGNMRRFDVHHKKVRDTIASGKIGTPETLRFVSREPGLPHFEFFAGSGGIFFDAMIHDFDLAQFYCADEVVEVYAAGNNFVEPRLEQYKDVDTTIVMLKLKNGTIGTVEACRRAAYAYDQRTEVHCSKGGIQLGNVLPTTTVIVDDAGTNIDKPEGFFIERYLDAFGAATRAFFDMVNNDTPSPVSARDGLKGVLIAIAAQKSYETGLPVKIADIKP